MGSHYGTCEIIELEDEPKSSDSRANDKGKKPQESKSIQEDINKLFEAINVRTSFRGLTETGGTTPRNPSKRPMRVSTSFSTGIGYSEPVSLKQALRGLSISHASEMAAMKRLSKSNNNNLKPSLPLTSEKSTKNVGTTVQMNEISVQEKNIISIGFRSCSIVADKASESSIMNDYEDKSMKAVNKATVIKLRRKGRLLISSNKLVKSTRASTPNKQNLNKKSPSITMENDIFIPDKSQLLCQRCHCAIKDAQNNNMNSKCENQSDFTQSSNSSIGEYSSSTSISEESHVSSRCSIGNRPHMSTNMGWHAIQNTKKQNGFLALKHFNLLKKLGSGDIGTVYLAELTGTNCLFAIKVMDNEFLERRKKMGRAHTEREILRILDHPFLPTLYAHFVSDNLSCLVMEYCPGGDLHVLRQKQPGRYYHEQAARFYVAEVLLALEYLHMLGIIYRDLKPENILVRQDGHIMLTDFDLSLRCSSVSPTLLQSPSSYAMQPHRMSGSNCIDHPLCSIKPTCHQVSCFSPRIKGSKKTKRKPDLTTLQLVAEPIEARSNSFVGTHEYLAPEIIKGNGHGSAVDWWTFGIFLYELLYGKTPFKGLGNDETLANVVMESLKFPDTPLVSFQARDLINRLLVKEPENRLGSQKGAAEIKQHPFFDGLNWALIRCAIPPEVPECYDIGADKSSSVKFEIF